MKKVILSGTVANGLEWYDFALYAHFATLIGRKFFPSFDQDAQTLSAFAVFAVGFLMRPIGAVLFGAIGDKYGRKKSLSFAIIMMSVPTGLVSILPTYNDIGIWAPVLLCIIRLLQGLSLGGALIGSVSYIVEHAPKNRKGLAGSASMFSLCFGFLLGSAVAWLLSSIMSEADFDRIGWRIPFLLGVSVISVSYYLKKHGIESPEFEKAKAENKIVKNPLAHLLKKYKLVMLTSFIINSLGSVGFYMLCVFLPNYLQTQLGLSIRETAQLDLISMIVIMIGVVLAGYLSDIIGRRRWFIITQISTLILIWTVTTMIDQFKDFHIIIIGECLFAILVAAYIGPEPALQVEMYPTEVRNTGVSVSYNLGCAIFGGLTPVISKLLFNKFQTIDIMPYYISFVALLSMVGVLFYKNRSDYDPN